MINDLNARENAMITYEVKMAALRKGGGKIVLGYIGGAEPWVTFAAIEDANAKRDDVDRYGFHSHSWMIRHATRNLAEQRFNDSRVRISPKDDPAFN